MNTRSDRTYVLVTPCFNEEDLIEHPLKTVTMQTIKPLRWVVVDDGSQDGTAGKVKNYSLEIKWIEYLYNHKIPNQTYYSSNVYAILAGVNRLKDLEYSFIGILDADIELCSDYYERVIEKFFENPRLGIATGTYFEQENNKWIEAKIDRMSTPKAIQVFRRECYEGCGGYIPFKQGGEDTGIEVMARMGGWETRSFTEIQVKHHRPVGTRGGRSLIKARMQLGMTDYCVGTHPVFFFFKCLKRMFWEKPYIISAIARAAGYTRGFLGGYERQLPRDAIRYLREEQLGRLKLMTKYKISDTFD